MNHSHLATIIGVGLVLFAPGTFAQTPAPTSKSALANPAGNEKSTTNAEAEGVRKERQSQARYLLISLASDARNFRDLKLRTRSLTRIADTLWDSDSEQGRTVLRQAWEAAATYDRESKEPSNLRRQVLAVAGRRDRLLAEAFLQKMKDDQEETKSEGSQTNFWELADALQHRLSLAESLLRAGNVERALQFADPVLGSVTMSTLDFLSDLRDVAPAAADQRYASMLANSSSNVLADANTISLLSSYIFSPHSYVIFNTQGGADSAFLRSPLPPANVSPQLRLAFFQVAGGVLLRPQPPSEQDRSTTGIAGKYMVMKRMMPLFEQYAPKEITAAMRDQFVALNSAVSEELRQTRDDLPRKETGSEKPPQDQVQSLLDDIDHAKTSDERDQLYFRLAQLALTKDDMKARDYVGKIDESEFRKQAQAWVDSYLTISAIKNKKIATALELIRLGELTHIQRVWVLTQTAKLLAKTDRDKALALLQDATAEVNRIEGLDADRARGLLAIANALNLVDPSRAWDSIFDAVKAANSAEGFTGEEGALNLNMRSKAQILRKTESVPDFDIRGIFGEMASNDYERAVQLAHGFRGEAPRANATIAICRAVLREKSSSAPAPAIKN